MKRPSKRQARIVRVSPEDQLTAIAGVLVHGAVFGVRPEHLPDPAMRQVFEAVLIARARDGRDLIAMASLVREEIGARSIDGGEGILADAISFSELEAPMRPHELEMNARHLERANRFMRLMSDLERAHEAGEHALEAEIAAELAELERGNKRAGGLVVVKASELEEKPVEWLWPGYVPCGQLVLLASPPKCGKSTLTVSIAARVSCGAPWPSGPDLPSQPAGNAPAADVLFIAYEDDLERTVKPRLIAAGANMDRVHFLRGVKRRRGSRETLLSIDLAEHFEEIEDLVRRLGIGLVIVDPVMSGFSSGRDTNADNEVRAVLGPYVPLAEETRATVFLVTHTNKRGEGAALDSAIGSRAFTGICRAVLALARFNDGSGRRLLAQVGANLGAPRPGLVFEIRSRDGNEARSHIQWLEEFDGDMDDFRAAQRKQGREAGGGEPDGRQASCNQAMLAIVDREFWIESRAIDAELESLGHAPAAIKRARTALVDQSQLAVQKCGDQWWTGRHGTAPQGPRFTLDAERRLEAARRRGGIGQRGTGGLPDS